MSQDPQPSKYSLGQIEAIVQRLRAELANDPDLPDEQRAAIEALLAYYLQITKALQRHIDDLSGVGGGP